jgi:hypothetical protein
LYVAKDNDDASAYCKGSTVCINMLKSLSNVPVTVQNVHVLMASQTLPPWLDGTPILVDTGSSRIYRGSDALFQISTMMSEEVQRREASSPKANAVEEAEEYIDDVFATDVANENANATVTDGKITNDDLQKFMQERNRILATNPNT